MPDNMFLESVKKDLMKEMNVLKIQNYQEAKTTTAQVLQGKIMEISKRYNKLTRAEEIKLNDASRTKFITKIQRNYRKHLSKKKEETKKNEIEASNSTEFGIEKKQVKNQDAEIQTSVIEYPVAEKSNKEAKEEHTEKIESKIIKTTEIETQTQIQTQTQTQTQTAMDAKETKEVKEVKEKESTPVMKNETPNSIKRDSLIEMRLLLGSEQLLKEKTADFVKEFSCLDAKDSGKIDLPSMYESESVFSHGTFQQFTLNKIKDIIKDDNLAKVISMRERIMKYKELTEKRYMHKMYKAKKLSSISYYSKKKELEKWVTKEKEEIKKNKQTLLDAWNKTAQMINEANNNTLQIKRLLYGHSLSYISNTNSAISLQTDLIRPETEREVNEGSKTFKEFKKTLKHDSSLEDLSGNMQLGDDISRPSPIQSKQECLAQNYFKGLCESDDEEIDQTKADHKENNKDLAKGLEELSAELEFELEQEKPVKNDKKEEKEVKEDDSQILLMDNVTPTKPAAFSTGLKRMDAKFPRLDDINSDGLKLLTQEEVNNLYSLNEPNMIEKEKETEDEVKIKEREPEIKPKVEKKVASKYEITKISPEKQKNIYIEEYGLDTKQKNAGSPQDQKKTVAKEIKEKPKSKERISEEIANNVYALVMRDIIDNLFPSRSKQKTKSVKPAKQEKEIVVPTKIERLENLRYKDFQADANYIKDYLDELFVIVMATQKQHCIREVNQAIVRPATEVLMKLQSANMDTWSLSVLPQELNPILPATLYLNSEKRREASKCRKCDNPNLSLQAKDVMEESEHIYNKAIFDAVNEAFNLVRPYGLNCEPMPWSSIQRTLFKNICDPSIIVKNITGMILDWASFEAGTLPSADFIFDNKFDEDVFAETREKRLASLLTQEVIDNEEMWLNYEMEEAEVGIDITDMTLEQLVIETVESVIKIENARKKLISKPIL